MDKQFKKILLVEDDLFMLRILEKKLKDNYELITVSNGQEAFEKAKSIDPDLILLDLVMPKVNGFEFLEMAKEHVMLRDIPIVIQSALSSVDDIKKAKKLGAKDFFIKGQISLEEILELIQKHV